MQCLTGFKVLICLVIKGKNVVFMFQYIFIDMYIIEEEKIFAPTFYSILHCDPNKENGSFLSAAFYTTIRYITERWYFWKKR